ncbi:MAG: hypothetical protein JRJ65_09285, partial [Deltaproteobacteria bacterium]|nr:hypothetical protein [Deltaproteobacteria bacterium]
MKRIILRFLFITFLLVVFGTLLSQSQARSQRWRKASSKILGIDKILKSKPPITTGISDAVTEVPFLDDFYPEGAVPMGVLPRTPEGGFVLEQPGNYVFESQSYCLKAGTYAPSEGRGGAGHLYAPQKGPQVDIIRSILQNSLNHPEIPQHDIQTLLWAVLSRTKIRNMSLRMRLTAAKLLTLKEIFRINGGALGLIPKRLVERAFEKLPP